MECRLFQGRERRGDCRSLQVNCSLVSWVEWAEAVSVCWRFQTSRRYIFVMGLIHTAAMLSQGIEKALFYMYHPRSEKRGSEARQVKQSYFSFSGQNGRRVTKAHEQGHNIHIQILQTDLHIFPSRISRENLIKIKGILSYIIILVILIAFSFDNIVIFWGENWCCSLLGLNGSRYTYPASRGYIFAVWTVVRQLTQRKCSLCSQGRN